MLIVLINIFAIVGAHILSPTEMVEEWGCYDTIIRLTCSGLESKIAILEATFTPNCTNLTEEECTHLHLKRLTKVYTSSNTDHRIAETEAGRKFLEQLRKAYSSERDNMMPNKSNQNHFYSLKAKRNSLRASLEQLIVQYLDGLSAPAESDFSDNYLEYSRKRRNSINDTVITEYSIEDIESDNIKYDNDTEPIEKLTSRIEIASRNITVVESDIEDYVYNIDRYESLISKNLLCFNRRRRVVPLSQYEMDKSVQNESAQEHNIRRVLNYRCSGKNHCSFVFAVDHPFSLIWDSGTVRVKYACMENFRLNQFCGESLRIGDAIKDGSYLQNNEELRGEPIAEARISDQSFHHVKILKPSSFDPPIAGPFSQETNKKSPKQKNQKIFSQDFRIIKILPNDLDAREANKKEDDDFYFNNEKTFPTVQSIFSTQKIQILLPDTLLNEVIQPNDELNFKDDLTILEDSDSMLSVNNYTANDVSFSTISSTILTTSIINDTRKLLQEDIIATGKQSPSDISNETIDLIYNESRINNDSNRPQHIIELVTDLPALDFNANGEAVITSSYKTDDEDYTYEDYTVERSGSKTAIPKQFITYSSHQKTALKRPLIEGFIASVGYPKFYIGESHCNWTIFSESGRKILLTLLDINLRYDPICKDFLQIIDLEVGRILFNSCSEFPRPLQVLSDSTSLQITIKTTSKVAYPKRGILIHYTAYGCSLPPSPLNGRLIYRTEQIAKYNCDPLFVFPDTAVSSRELICTERRTWDKSLPNCIAKTEAIGTGAITVSRFNHSKESHKMTDKQSDMLFDVAIPSFIIAGLFVVNAVVFFIIMRYRNKRKQYLDNEQQELAQL